MDRYGRSGEKPSSASGRPQSDRESESPTNINTFNFLPPSTSTTTPTPESSASAPLLSAHHRDRRLPAPSRPWTAHPYARARDERRNLNLNPTPGLGLPGGLALPLNPSSTTSLGRNTEETSYSPLSTTTTTTQGREHRLDEYAEFRRDSELHSGMSSSATATARPPSQVGMQAHYVHSQGMQDAQDSRYWAGVYAQQQQQQQQQNAQSLAQSHHPQYRDAGPAYGYIEDNDSHGSAGLLPDNTVDYHAHVRHASGGEDYTTLLGTGEGAYAIPGYRLHASSEERSTAAVSAYPAHVSSSAPDMPVASSSRLPQGPATSQTAASASSRHPQPWLTEHPSTLLQQESYAPSQQQHQTFSGLGAQDAAVALVGMGSGAGSSTSLGTAAAGGTGKRGRGSRIGDSPEMPESDVSVQAAGGKKKAKTARGRERMRIALAPDQPPTTQGKQRERVYVACNQCRSRKIRCDGAKPMCFNCRQRGTGICEFDTEPKRRGPDRQPGARQRLGSTSAAAPTGRRNSRAARSIRGVGSSDVQSGAPDYLHLGEGERGEQSPSSPQHDAPPENLPPEGSHNTVREPGNTLAHLSRVVASTPSTSAVPPSSDARSSGSGSGPLPIHTAGYAGSGMELPALHAGAPLSYTHSEPETPSKLLLRSQQTQHSQPQNNTSAAVFVLSTSEDGAYLRPHDPGVHVAAQQSVPPAPALYVRPVDAPVLPPRGQLLTPPNSAVELRRASRDSQASLESSVSPPSIYGGPDQPGTAHMRHVPSALVSAGTAAAGVPSHFPQPVIVEPEAVVAAGHHPAYDEIGTLSLQSAHANAHLLGGVAVGVVGATADDDDVYLRSAAAAAELQKADHGNIHVVPPHASYGYNPYQWAVDQADEADSAAYITPVDDEHSAHTAYSIAPTPSLEFIRKTWWDSLLDTYCSEVYCSPLVAKNYQKMLELPDSVSVVIRTPYGCVPTGATRQYVADIVLADIRSVFRDSNFWFAFMNLPLFFETFYTAREMVQPALVLAMLMHANFMRSSEAELGEEGRVRTFWLREKAHAALDASVYAGCVDPGLAQAAWLLTVFEISAQPKRNLPAIDSALERLDGIIRTLGMTSLDADETAAHQSSSVIPTGQRSPSQQSATHVLPLPLYNRLPISQSPQARLAPPTTSQLLQYHAPSPNAPTSASVHSNTTASESPASCPCSALSLARNWPKARELTPFWLCTPAWSASWSAAEIRREECRRLCWNTLLLIAGYTTYRASMGMSILDLSVVQPSNYRNVFPGENLTGLTHGSRSGSGSPTTPTYYVTETVWALYARAMLLWHACLRIRDVSTQERAVFAQAVWLEAGAIESALDGHTCQLERAFLFQGREYLFNARMYVSNEFRRFVPHPSPDMIGSVHRQKAEEWITHQAELSKRVMNGLQTVTGLPGNLLSKRPFFVFWFMGHVSRCLQLWRLDHALAPALELSKSFLRPIEYLSALWPCQDQLNNYLRIRRALEHACAEAGLSPPPPLDLSLPKKLL